MWPWAKSFYDNDNKVVFFRINFDFLSIGVLKPLQLPFYNYSCLILKQNNFKNNLMINIVNLMTPVISQRAIVFSEWPRSSHHSEKKCPFLRKSEIKVFVLITRLLQLLLQFERRIHSNFFVIKPTRCTNFTNLFCHETLHVSDSSSVHHQEFFTVHSAMVYVIQVCRQLSSPARKLCLGFM